MKELSSESAAATESLGESLGAVAAPGLTLFLSGELGAGKTTLVRGFLRGLGWRGKVGSPTYTLIEPYEAGAMPVYHFDLYRLQSPDELEAIGFRDYFDGRGVCVIEWPERARGLLGEPDVLIELQIRGNTRRIALSPRSEAGSRWLARALSARTENGADPAS
jgi:tRNA threonylcarbamoyladenosine biosynthesis protein TsaE